MEDAAQPRAYAQADFAEDGNRFLQSLRDLDPVSYTHLTLPTSDLV